MSTLLTDLIRVAAAVVVLAALIVAAGLVFAIASFPIRRARDHLWRQMIDETKYRVHVAGAEHDLPTITRIAQHVVTEYQTKRKRRKSKAS